MASVSTASKFNWTDTESDRSRFSIADPRPSSRFAGFYKLTPEERVGALEEAGIVSEKDGAFLLGTPGGGLSMALADLLVENTIGVLALPIGLGLNFTVNDRDYVIPMVVEEPSVVAAVSGAAKLVRQAGGFEASSTPPLMLGQIQVTGCKDPHEARDRLLAHKAQLLARADELCASMVERGGGARDLDARIIGPVGAEGNGDRIMVVLHLIIDTRDAMGANTINTVMEGLADKVEEIAGGGVHLRILSNLPDRCRARARCEIPADLLKTDDFTGAEVARRIMLASLFADIRSKKVHRTTLLVRLERKCARKEDPQDMLPIQRMDAFQPSKRGKIRRMNALTILRRYRLWH